jgi:hypothetical protein
MIVDQINVVSVAFLKAEDHAPVRPDRHAPKVFQIALERAEPETWETHVAGLSGAVEDGEDILDFLDVSGMDAFGSLFSKSRFNPLCRKPRITGGQFTVTIDNSPNSSTF